MIELAAIIIGMGQIAIVVISLLVIRDAQSETTKVVTIFADFLKTQEQEAREERDALEQKLMALSNPVSFTEYQTQKDNSPGGEVGYIEDENLDTEDPDAFVVEPV